MDIYKKKSTWKIYLAILGVLIVLVSLVYTNYLAGKLAEEEKKKVELWLMAIEEINDFDNEDIDYCGLEIPSFIIRSNTTIPVIIVNERGGIDAVANFDRDLEGNEPYFKKEVAKLQATDYEPIQGFAVSIYYKESNILRQLRFFPFIQLLLIGSFVLFGYLALNAARRAEQNRIWAGMAKETAHQLGTPISAIMAWVEHLRLIRDKDPEVLEIAEELSKDVGRLDLVADRFSKIGSAPKLESVNIYQELDECRHYMQKRAPRKVSFDFPAPDTGDYRVNINKHLFDWVVENLLRNALDAMDGKGHISAKIYPDEKYINIDLTDTGKGIPTNKFKTIFKPGFTTKSRGWGLGLSLAKRIVEEYHSGKIFVKNSEENKGTTFTIRLPKAN
ncbi:MAG: HAMP domain-containing histidine kinase [Saprospiraceae bacterium]|nr:HAMP domain-containing histidine kinase [Saprospiraceae bacterium]MCB9326946.1 HAMP domain-containing histidine kinase [Lewinellaceae bacterium]